jgi:hypothetical protein
MNSLRFGAVCSLIARVCSAAETPVPAYCRPWRGGGLTRHRLIYRAGRADRAVPIAAQPKYAYWFAGVGWALENHGVDPDVEVTIAPHDWAAGRDPQLDTAVRLALQALEQRTPAAPPAV